MRSFFDCRQQPYHQIAALVGDIVATRFKIRGIRGFFTDGRMRDVVGVEDLCKEGGFTAWAKGFSSVGTSIEGDSFFSDVVVATVLMMLGS